MADAKISQLPVATTPLAGTELMEIVQGGVNKQVTTSEVGGGAVDSVNGQTGVVQINADDVPFTPAGNIAATDVQAAIEELDSETANGRAAVDTTGTAIAFAIPQTYGSVGSPETGNVTLVTTNLVKGMVQLLLHNHSSEPTFGSEFKKISGVYVVGVLNSIYMHAVSTTRIEYTISQEI